MEIWKSNKAKVAELNSKSGNNGVRFGVNGTCDMTDAEFKKMQGLKLPNDKTIPDNSSNNGNGRGKGFGLGSGRGLQSD